MKYLKWSALALLALAVMVCLHGCAERNSDTGKEEKKENTAAVGDVASSQIMFCLGEETDCFVYNNKVTQLPGKLDDLFMNEECTGAVYVVNDTTYFVTGGRVKELGKNVKGAAFQSGTGCVYTADQQNIHFYDAKTDTTTYTLPKPYDDESELAISYGGEAMAYLDEQTGCLILYRDGEQITLEEESTMRYIEHVSSDGELVYVKSSLSSGLYCYKANGESLHVDADTFCGYNKSGTQLLVVRDDITYLYENGNGPVVFASGDMNLLNDDVDDFYGQVYSCDEGTVLKLICRDQSQSCTLLSNQDVVQYGYTLQDDAEHLIYKNHQQEVRLLRISDGEQAAEKSVRLLEQSEHAFDIRYSEDLEDIYYIECLDGVYTLYHKSGDTIREITKLYEACGWSKAYVMTEDGKGIYYSTLDALYYYDGTSSTKVADGHYFFNWYLDAMYAIKSTTDADGWPEKFLGIYLIRGNHDLQYLGRIPEV